MMTSNQAVGELSKSLQVNDYPTSYLRELTNYVEIKPGDNSELTATQSDKLKHVLTSLAAQVPIEYLVGEALFCERRFKATPDVLIPRFDTEKLVNISLEVARTITEPLTIIDIGTGSGAIIITLAKELEVRKDIEYLAMDISPQALAIAKENAKKHAMHNVIDFRLADTFPRNDLNEPYLPTTKNILIVSNPPYISETNYAALPKSVKDYEPKLALLEQTDFLDKLGTYLGFLRRNGRIVQVILEYSDLTGTAIQINIPSESDFQQTIRQVRSKQQPVNMPGI